MLPVLVQGGGADAVQFTAGQHGLQHVAGVHGPLGRASADHGVQFVNEQDDLTLGVGDFFEDGLQPLLEFAPELGPGDQGSQVQGHDAFVLEALGHVAAHDALGQPLGDGRLAHPRLADEDRVVFGAS